ncbi:hypothetical protein CC80DRAFT_542570 [Byssothecium circinans]|uniref:Uncharacterized protein n=1 Tax=Byssothecium circinans TaxID=147558 RepID=A0A6A5UET1_9PLEO|nr:hypothetical protein CC80DRAFT_542570 [Byssothecium circinans]
MRLIDVDNLEIITFHEHEVPEYAILSHTWGPDECSYHEMCMIARMRSMSDAFNSSQQASSPNSNGYLSGNATVMLAAVEMLVRGNWSFGAGLPDFSEEALMKREGYAKIVNSAKLTKELGYQWIWCDTCCIDKSSSAELQEAINTMYRWYKEAAVCLVYLNDVEPGVGEKDGVDTHITSDTAVNAFTNCRWRGWTLQELVAPFYVRFYFKDWSYMGDKYEFASELADATGIPVFVLENGDLSEVSLAERMSWGALRRTTRTEDMAYCLLGIFDIQMPLLYGEGEKAFIRLQEEILKTTDDYSLFAWRSIKPKPGSYTSSSVFRGLLAHSPMEFMGCEFIERENITSVYPVTSTPIGLRLQLEFLPDPKDDTRFLAMLRCCNNMNQRLAIHLKRLDSSNQYARVDTSELVPIDNWPTGQLRTIYIRQKPSIPPDFYTPEIRCFHIQRRTADRSASIPPIRITDAFPPESWSPENQQLSIPESSKDFLGVLFLRGQSPPYGESTNFQVIVGLNRKTKHYWCKAVVYSWPRMDVDRSRWRAVIKKVLPKGVNDPDPLMKSDCRHDIFVVPGDIGLGVNVCVRAGMWGDSVVLQVLIDGLVKVS